MNFWAFFEPHWNWVLLVLIILAIGLVASVGGSSRS